MRVKHLVTAWVLLVLLAWNAPQARAEDFYTGKTIRVVVGFSAGGGYDTYARLLSRHMSKHIPGNPTMIVENMTGAGSLVAANYTYSKAPRDGTFIGVWNSSYVLYQALGDKAVRIDGKKLGWIGAPVKGSPHCSVMGFTGITSMDELLKSGKSLKMGATRAGSTYNDLPKVLNQTIGTKFDVITGYPGTSQITVAMRSREVDGGCWGWESARVTARAMLDAKGDDRLIPIINHRKWEDKKVANVPVTREYIRARAGKDGMAVYNW
jgi:tripartite-type tricarboxylate transporter receptor subunit TctC